MDHERCKIAAQRALGTFEPMASKGSFRAPIDRLLAWREKNKAEESSRMVIAGLDRVIHPLEETLFGWLRGSSG